MWTLQWTHAHINLTRDGSCVFWYGLASGVKTTVPKHRSGPLFYISAYACNTCRFHPLNCAAIVDKVGWQGRGKLLALSEKKRKEKKVYSLHSATVDFIGLDF